MYLLKKDYEELKLLIEKCVNEYIDKHIPDKKAFIKECNTLLGEGNTLLDKLYNEGKLKRRW